MLKVQSCNSIGGKLHAEETACLLYVILHLRHLKSLSPAASQREQNIKAKRKDGHL